MCEGHSNRIKGTVHDSVTTLRGTPVRDEAHHSTTQMTEVRLCKPNSQVLVKVASSCVMSCSDAVYVYAKHCRLGRCVRVVLFCTGFSTDHRTSRIAALTDASVPYCMPF